LARSKNQPIIQSVDGDSTKKRDIPISPSLLENKQMIQKMAGDGSDVFGREFVVNVSNKQDLSIFITGIDGLVDERTIREQVVEPLLANPLDINTDVINSIKERLYVKDVNEEKNLYSCLLKMNKGSTIILIDSLQTAIVIGAISSAERSIEEPPTGIVVSGSREGFVENLATNISLLRKRISHPSLKFVTYTLGEFSQTDVAIVYVQGVVDPKTVERMDQLIRKIDVDDISSSGQIEQYLSENTYSIFSTTGNTERPDQLAAMLMEGRSGVIINGDPVALYYPSLFIEKLQSVEDYSSKPFYSSFIRILRFFAFLLSILLPAFYVGAVNFHKEMIPSSFLLILKEAREGVPFPLVLETFMLLIIFEIVREAGVRMPRAIGQAVSIVGALIIGEVSVQAGLISAQTIIVVATASITTFIVTPVAEVASLLRLLYIIPSALFGLYGLMVCLLITVTHMVNLKSMGVPYLSPIMPLYIRDWKDALVRFPYKLLKFRPKSIPNVRPVRYKKVPQQKGEEDDSL